MSNHAPDNLVQCFNKFAPLSDIDEECYDSMENVNQSLVDTCTFAGQGTLGDDQVDSFTRIDKDDKFDTLLLKKKVDQCTIAQAKACKDYRTCKSQMGEPFGVIPLSPLLVYTGKNTNNNQVSDPLSAHKLVRHSGCPNFLGSRIPVD